MMRKLNNIAATPMRSMKIESSFSTLAPPGDDDAVGAARLVDDSGAEVVVVALTTDEAVGHRAGAEIGGTGENQPGRFSLGMGVEKGDSAQNSLGWHL